MSLLTALLLGVIQGLTELLPVSSTGHLVLAEALLGVHPGLAFDVALHGGTLGAIIVYFRKDVARLGRGALGAIFERDLAADPARRLAALIVLASVPAAVIGLSLRDFIDHTLRSPVVIAVALIVVGVIILVVERLCRPRRPLEDLRGPSALAIGFCQALALIPGTSRSGATIAGALALGFRREEAVRFSFLLGIPVIGGAVLLEGIKVARAGFGETGGAAFAVGIVAAFISGYAAIALLMAYVRTRTFAPFMYYRIALGLVVLGWWWFLG